MPQNLIQLPKSACIENGGWFLFIENHEVLGDNMFTWILYHIVSGTYSSQAVPEMEKCKISYEAVIEECVWELEHNPEIIGWIINWHYSIVEYSKKSVEFAKVMRAGLWHIIS